MFSQKDYDLAQKGEIVSTKSLLAFDEELVCKQCGHIFPLAEGTWFGEHPKFKGIELHGIKCPQCERVNVTYVKTPRLKALEKIIDNAQTIAKEDKARAKYKREFSRVQKKFGRIDVTT